MFVIELANGKNPYSKWIYFLAMQTVQYCVFHITKYKQLGGIGHHIDRLAKNPNKGEVDEELKPLLGMHIDPEKTDLNEEWVEHKGKSLNTCVEERIQEGYKVEKAIRKDAVKALGIMLTGSHERMKEIEAKKDLFDKWKQEKLSFCL